MNQRHLLRYNRPSGYNEVAWRDVVISEASVTTQAARNEAILKVHRVSLYPAWTVHVCVTFVDLRGICHSCSFVRSICQIRATQFADSRHICSLGGGRTCQICWVDGAFVNQHYKHWWSNCQICTLPCSQTSRRHFSEFPYQGRHSHTWPKFTIFAAAARYI